MVIWVLGYRGLGFRAGKVPALGSGIFSPGFRSLVEDLLLGRDWLVV